METHYLKVESADKIPAHVMGTVTGKPAGSDFKPGRAVRGKPIPIFDQLFWIIRTIPDNR